MDSLPNCFVCENKLSTCVQTNICDTHKLIVCKHGFTRSYLMCDENAAKCSSLCEVNGCTKNKDYFINGKFTNSIFNGPYSRCEDHYRSCACGQPISNIGFKSKCIGCIIIGSIMFRNLAGNNNETKIEMVYPDEIYKNSYDGKKKPVSLLEIMIILYRHIDRSTAMKIINYLEYV